MSNNGPAPLSNEGEDHEVNKIQGVVLLQNIFGGQWRTSFALPPELEQYREEAKRINDERERA